MIDLLIKLDPRTQAQIGVEAGLNAKEFNDKLHNRGNRLTEDDVVAVAKALKVQPDLLMDDVPEEKVLIALGIGKSPRVSEGVAPAGLYDLAERWLTPVPDVSEMDRRVAIPVYASIAAGGLDDRTAVKEPEPIYLDPASYRGCKAVRVDGDSMVGFGIDHRDILIVKRSKSPKEGDIVVALVEHEGTIKQYRTIAGEEMLCPGNPKYGNIPLRAPSYVQGVVLAIHKPSK